MNRLVLAVFFFVVVFCFCSDTWSRKISEGVVDTEIRDTLYNNGVEVLQYEISWSGGIKIGDLLIEIGKDLEFEDTYTIHAKVNDSGIFHFFYPVNDTFITRVTGDKRLPVLYDVKQHEGSSYKAIRHTEYDQKKGIVRYRKNQNNVEIFRVEGEVHNEFSSFLFTRIIKLDTDNPVIVPTFADKTRHEVVVKTANKIRINNQLLGKVDVLPVSPIMDFKGLYDKSGDTVIYLTDDLCRVPVRINSKILLGSITAELVFYRSSTCLKYSLHNLETPLGLQE